MLQSHKKLRRGEALPRKVCSLLLHKSKIRGESNGAHKSDCDDSSESPEGLEGATRSPRNCSMSLHFGRDHSWLGPCLRSNLLAGYFPLHRPTPAGRYGGKSFLMDDQRNFPRSSMTCEIFIDLACLGDPPRQIGSEEEPEFAREGYPNRKRLGQNRHSELRVCHPPNHLGAQTDCQILA
jgi:hypothetical protein